MRVDLEKIGFTDIREVEHGETVVLGGALRITSYQTNLFTDSALIIEGDGTCLFNMNDAKFTGGPLRRILRSHPSIDFVFRSHSTANSRANYQFIDVPSKTADPDPERYAREFAAVAQAVKARYAVPFASNHCHLHRDVFHLNDLVTTPLKVADYFERHGITSPELKVLVSGDGWDSQSGFNVAEQDWFTHRAERLAAYQARNQKRLRATYEREARARLSLPATQRYFQRLFSAMPRPLALGFRGCPILFVLSSGSRQWFVEVDFWARQVREVEDYSDESHPIQYHLPMALMRHCMADNLFSHLAISKRVRYRVHTSKESLVKRLNLFWNLYEYGWFPLRGLLGRRFLGRWGRRWREGLLYARMITNLARGRPLSILDYLPAVAAPGQPWSA